MSTLENEVTFRQQTQLNHNLESQFSNSSTEFILLTDHRTSKFKSLEQLEAAKQESNESCCSRRCDNICRLKTLKRRLPILTWLPKYNRSDALGDLIAGLTVGLTVIPQGLAYSGVVNLPPQVSCSNEYCSCGCVNMFSQSYLYSSYI